VSADTAQVGPVCGCVCVHSCCWRAR
jgi:hypothetical protein